MRRGSLSGTHRSSSGPPNMFAHDASASMPVVGARTRMGERGSKVRAAHSKRCAALVVGWLGSSRASSLLDKPKTLQVGDQLVVEGLAKKRPASPRSQEHGVRLAPTERDRCSLTVSVTGQWFPTRKARFPRRLRIRLTFSNPILTHQSALRWGSAGALECVTSSKTDSSGD